MGQFFMLVVATLVVLLVAQGDGSLTSEVYWRSMLPNTPMPIAIRKRLSSSGDLVPLLKYGHARKEQIHNVGHQTVNSPDDLNPNSNKDKRGVGPDHLALNNHQIDSPSAPFFFLERDLHVGAKIGMMLRKPTDGGQFLPPRVAGSIPFSSSRLPEILDLFSIDPYSSVAKKMEQVHYYCELPPLPGSNQRCATSLESMVDFVTSSLNNSTAKSNMLIKVLSSTAEKETSSTHQLYTMASILPAAVEGTTTALCHLEQYPYTVYRCHTIAATKPYVVKLVGDQADGSTAEVAIACHRDTSHWDARHYALKALKVKPGEASVCHFLPVGDVAFFPTDTDGGDGDATVFVC